jgi:N-acyl-L-homoserine lactone synthetase
MFMTVLSKYSYRLPLFCLQPLLPSAEFFTQFLGGKLALNRPVLGIEPERKTSFKIASRREELKAALELVYRVYVNSGLTRPSRHGIRVTQYHTLPTTEVLVAKDHDKVVCTMSLVRDAELGLPMEAIYKREIGQLRRRGIRLAEVSCLADERKGEAGLFPVVSRLMALMAQCAVRRGVDRLVIAVHPRHAAFYQRFIAFETIGEEKTYAAVRNKPAVALVLDLTRLRLDHPKAYKRLFGKPFSEEVLLYKPISLKLRHELVYLAEELQSTEKYRDKSLFPVCA